jgi:hypothetical protein
VPATQLAASLGDRLLSEKWLSNAGHGYLQQNLGGKAAVFNKIYPCFLRLGI